MVNPLADNEHTNASTPLRRRRRLGTVTGSKVLARSRGTSNTTGPISVNTVLDLVPLREFPDP
jgi:hypothetical protein